MKKHHLKAFTILEVSVVMAIAAIVIGITYTVYIIVVKTYGNYQVKNNQMATSIRLDELLKKDFDHAGFIKINDKNLLLSTNGVAISYQLDSAFIVRSGIAIDTFKIKTADIKTAFEDRPVDESTTNEEFKRIDELQLMLLLEDKKIPYHYHKEYSSVNLIQRNPNAIN